MMRNHTDGPRNIILISIDDLRFDCIGCEEDRRSLDRYGADVEVCTPSIDGFASKGVRFSQAIAPASYTSSSHASLLTGLYPPSHGVRAFFYTKLKQEVRTLAQGLKDVGYSTFSSCDFRSMFDLLDISRGIDCRVDHDNTEALRLLEKHRNERIFLFLHFFDVHDPYGISNFEIHPGYNDDVQRDLERLCLQNRLEVSSSTALVKEAWFKGYKKEVVSQYIKGVNKFDRGRFSWFMQRLQDLSLLDDSLVVITSDHGEGDCGLTFHHGADLSEEVIRVPLIFWDPNRLPQGRVIDQQCSLVDVAPTILEIADAPAQPTEGTSLLPTMKGGPPLSYPVYAERWAHNLTDEDMKSFLRQCGERNAFCAPLFDVLLTHRSVRTPVYKLLVRGQPPSRQALSESTDFLKWAYQHVLHRHADPEGFAHWSGRLNDQGVSRDRLIEAFVSFADEKYSLFDIRGDPLESVNLLSDREFLPIADSMMDFLEEVESRETLCAPPDVTFNSENEAAFFKRQLRDLGYL